MKGFMKISINRNVAENPPSSSFQLTLSNFLFPKQTIGHTIIPPIDIGGLKLSSTMKLLYFRTKGCVVCGLVDMQVGHACAKAGVELVIVDRWTAEGRPNQDEPYLDSAGNIVDADGSINKKYRVAIYPTFVLLDANAKIVMREVGVQGSPESYDQYLTNRFQVASV